MIKFIQTITKTRKMYDNFKKYHGPREFTHTNFVCRNKNIMIIFKISIFILDFL